MVLVGEGGRKGALAVSGVDGSRGVVEGCGVMAWWTLQAQVHWSFRVELRWSSGTPPAPTRHSFS